MMQKKNMMQNKLWVLAVALLCLPACQSKDRLGASYVSAPKQPTLQAAQPGEKVPPEHQALQDIDISTIDLTKAVGIAIARHPDIGRATAIVAQSEARISVEKSAWFPTFQYGVNPGYSRYYGGNNGSNNDATLRGTVSATQLIYDFGTTKNRIGEAQSLRERSRHMLSSTVENVAANVATIFIELSAAQDLIEAAQREYIAMRQTREKIVDRTQSGLSDATDLNQADVALQRARGDLLSAQTRFDVAAGRFAEITGVRPKKVASLEQTSKFIDRLGKLDSSVESSPMVLAADQEVKAAMHRVSIARSRLLPSISLQASQQKAIGGRNITNDSSFVGLQVGGSLNSGFGERHRIVAAEAELDAARQESENERLMARTSLGSAETEARGAGERMSNAQQMIALSLNSRALYWQQYTLNRRPLTDVVNAERDAFMAESDHIAAMADYMQARIRAYSAVGDLVDRIRAQQ